MIEGKLIYQADIRGVNPNVRQEIIRAREQANIDPSEIDQYHPQSVATYFIDRWRGQVNGLHQAALNTWDGARALGLLQEACDVITKYFYLPCVLEAAIKAQTTEPREYQPAALLAFDQGNHWLILGKLVKRDRYLEKARENFSLAAARANPETSTQWLAFHQRRLLEEILDGKKEERDSVAVKEERKIYPALAQEAEVLWIELNPNTSLRALWGLRNLMRRETIKQYPNKPNLTTLELPY